jgi:hypothetical protein
MVDDRKEMWTCQVDGLCYGFFTSQQKAYDWIAKEFPVAYTQGNYVVTEFCSI